MLTVATAAPNKAILSERIQKLISGLANGVYEREETIKIMFISRIGW